MLTGARHRRTRGFTLMEVMTALFVFSLLVVVFSSSLIVAKSASKINGEYAQAISLAQHKMDQLRAIGFGRLKTDELVEGQFVDDDGRTASPYSFLVVDQVADYLPGASAGHGPTAVLRIDPHPGGDTRIKKVTVTITWRASPRRSGDSRVEQIAYIANAE